MATSLVVFLFASALALPAQASPIVAPGCGPANVKLDVKSARPHVSPPAVEPGKALIVFLQDDAKFGSRPRPTTRFGVDGAWIGATQANSYFFASINPGEHHICASWQSRVSLLAPVRGTAAAHFTAEAGKTYYFEARDVAITDHSGTLVSEPEVKLEPVDSDEALVLMNTFAVSSSHPRK